MRVLFTLPLLILFALASCRKSERFNAFETSTMPPPLVVLTSLADTLPEKSFHDLHVQNVHGFKVKYATGQSVSYFEYEADRNTVLRTIGNLPFSKYSPLADTSCRKVTNESIQMLRSIVSIEEQEVGISFWESSANETEIYECYKAPFRHILVITRDSLRIHHRIEYTG
jgi:hypothetical protein